MSDLVFPILGTENVPLIGRQELSERIWSELTKASPSNLSIVGPKYIGKTVILHSVVVRAKRADSPYSVVVYWQLGYSPPQSDDEFIKQLCDNLLEAMKVGPEVYREHRAELAAEKSFSALKEVMDLLQLEGHSVLMVWDGFDKPLSQGLLTGFLFGQLRDLFYGKRHRVITATRATQTELARNKHVEDSPFWNMFDLNPIRVGPFDPIDFTHAMEGAALVVTPGGQKELSNWTGGHPVLLLSALNALAQAGLDEIDNKQVNDVATQVVSDLSEFLDRLWNDFATSEKNAFQALVESGELEKDRIGKEEVKYLVARGFARRDGSKLKPTCRMLAQHIEGAKPDANTLSRLFGDWESYRREIRAVLELRIKQIRTVNNRLHRLVTRCLDDIPDHPNDCLNDLTRIEEVALDIIWQHEFDGVSSVPAEIVSYWTQPPRDNDNIIKRMMDVDDWRLPQDRFKQLAMLQCLTGSKLNFDSKAKSISKDTYVLLNAIHQFRNRTEHAEGQPIHEGVAVSALLLCIELLSCLERELS